MEESSNNQSLDTTISINRLESTIQSQQIQLEDIEPLTMYLHAASLSLLNCNKDQLHSQIHQNDAQQQIFMFASDLKYKVLVISVESENQFYFSVEIKSTHINQHSIAFVKRSTFAVVHGMTPTNFSQTIQIINLGFSATETSPISVNHLYVQNCFLPIFNQYKDSLDKQTNLEKEQYQTLLKKLNELNLALIQCQQSVEVPEIWLQFEPAIREKCQEAKKTHVKITEDDFSELAESEDFINNLASCVMKWTRAIATVCAMKHEIANGTTLQEINYWMSLERSLNLIDQQLKFPEVEITIKILESKTKFAVTNAFKYDLNFKNILQRCQASNSFTKDFPLNDLLSSHSLKEIIDAQNQIFVHMRRITQIQEYKPERGFQLLEAFSRDINSQMIKILRQFKLMSMNYQEFIDIMELTDQVFKKWNQDYVDFRSQLNRFRLIQYNQYSQNVYEHVVTLKKRLEIIKTIRVLHNRLREVIEKIIQKEKSSTKSDASFLNTKDISDAYMVFYDLDVLDTSKEGEEKLFQAQKSYELKIDKVETIITAQLIDKLGLATSANDMFRIFAKFNALFFRQHIRGAIQQYQTQLLTTVQKDIQALQEKFLKSYQKTDNSQISKVRDIPSTAGSVIWAQQIQRKLDKYLERVENVLGERWTDHVEGKKCKEVGENFKKALNFIPKIENWNKSIIEFTRTQNQNERIFEIVQKKKLEIIVNFDKRMIDLFKEMRFLQQLKTRINAYVTITAGDAKKLYPYAVSLQESIHQYNQISSKIDDKMSQLVASHRWEIHLEITKGMNISWSLKDQLGQYTKKLSEKVLALEEAINGLHESYDQINVTLSSMTSCPLDTMKDKLTAIQKIIDDFSFKKYSNLHIWVKELDTKLEHILGDRLVQLIKTWMEEFEGFRNESVEKRFILESPTHELKIRDQTIFIEPSMQQARFYWFKEFHKLIGLICNLPRLQADRYDQLHSDQQSERDNDYASILNKIDQLFLYKQYERIDYILNDAEKYVKTWLSYSSLWKIEARKIYESLGDDINKWQDILNEIKSGRTTFDNSETEIFFGAILIDYRLVQVKINNKYDQWHREILNHFGETFQEKLKSVLKNLTVSRGRLEKINLANTSSDLMVYITDLKEFNEKQNIWAIEMDSFKTGQKLLERQRFVHPSDWLWLDQVEQEWSNFKQLFQRRNKQFEKELPSLQQKIIADEALLLEKIKEIEEMWNTQKPYSGDLMPSKAVDILNILDGQLQRVRDDYKRCCKCKELLQLEPGNPQKLDDLNDDIQQLKDVWNEMNKVWKHVEDLRDTLISVIQIKKIEESTKNAQNELNKLPNNMKTYEAYEKMKNRIKHYGKMNKVISNVKTEAMKARHWKSLLSKIKMSTPYNDLTIGQLWNCDVIKHEKVIEDVLTIARGEQVLEEMLRIIKEFWQGFELELVRYQQKCKLIRGWDDLFAKFDEDLNNLSSMKISPYYKTFEEDIQPWDDKLQRYRIIMDTWIDVQRRWVYLESIFFGSSDIKTQLSNEYNRFKAIDSDFTSLMKKVGQDPKIDQVMKNASLLQTLERLADLLAKIQKALGDYLEMQRRAFARFYFVGDEDLLEIIGNSKDAANVQRHFTKMYAGITSLKIEKSDKNDDIIIGMLSKEGEYVIFDQKILVAETPKINEWLTLIDKQMRYSLASKLDSQISEIQILESQQNETKDTSLLAIIEAYPAQIVLLAFQVLWTTRVEKAFEVEKLQTVIDQILKFLTLLASNVVKDLKKDIRQKYEQIITEFVHQRDVVRYLLKKNVTNFKDFYWQYHMRFIYQPREQDLLQKLQVQMSNAQFEYGYEYLGVGEKLVQTPLTDQCYLTLTQALHLRMGGSPFGPAGTGKTESVKALGSQLGRFVLVFNCDETFDFLAMGRIFVGLCQVGAWGCFDEFNRLEERMLSAVSQQILIIQTGLRERQKKIDLMNREVKLNFTMGIFITMNPGYAGRSNLPENLKQLFRQMAMVRPDRDLIAQVMLFSQGFRTAEKLSGKIVSLFELCNDQLSSQPHYDFGLRALKSVLVSAGHMKRQETKDIDLASLNEAEMILFEQKILLRSVCETIVPKLVADDVPLLANLLQGVFPGSELLQIRELELREALVQVCKQRNYLPKEEFIQKVLQLFQIQRLHHGFMMVGPSGSGKTAAWKVLQEAMYRVDKIQGVSYVVDPKAINKDELYGKLDNTTMEWTDGIFTGILRKITENVRGEINKRHWIIFDGDVDPEWAENLNSVLDDNKLLTLPNGERIQIPPHVKIMFEVETLKYATLATVSRCGMVWFSDDIVDYKMIFFHYLQRLQQDDYDEMVKDESKQDIKQQDTEDQKVRKMCVESIQNLFEGDPSFIQQCVEMAQTYKHVMEFTKIRVFEAYFALIRKGISNVLDYNESHSDLPMASEKIEKYMTKFTLFAIIWGVAGSMTLHDRQRYGDQIAQISPVTPPQKQNKAVSIVDFEVKIDGEWSAWNKKVPIIEIDPNKVSDADLIITTVDTLRHQEILCSWLSEHRPFILCGPPGSGKTMTLMSTLKQLPDFEMIFINFSSGTMPSLILKQFEQYCEYVKTTQGIILRPKQPNKWLVVFCDEINLPDSDKYGTIIIITYLRQLTEQKGFWRSSDKQWVSLERIQFVGACNPPTDVGRKPLSDRFLRHCPLILVDFPGKESLLQIYGTFNRAMLKRVPHIKKEADSLTNAMVEFYQKQQQHFTADIRPHYIYSPRELTRWKHAINEALEAVGSVEELVRLWAHEALRLFEDRLVTEPEKQWCEKLIDTLAQENFPQLKDLTCLDRPILFTNYLSQFYISVDKKELGSYISARLKTFYEEELNVPIVVFDSVLEHILRIDRVLRQPLGHLLLVGASGVGKTTLTRFVSWMNNLSVFQIKAGRNYSLVDFDIDLRDVMKRAGCKHEKICFIFDESNVLSPAFLEKMNALLASGEIPGLFEGEEYLSLINNCKEAALKDNKMIDSDDQLYRNFIKAVQRNLHVVFTMNPSNPDFSNRTASSPALFNRCVIDWFGDWSIEALNQVAEEFTILIDPSVESFTSRKVAETEQSRHAALVQSIVEIHSCVRELNLQLQKSAKKFNYITPRDFLDFIKHFVEIYNEKRSKLEDGQFHLNVGLDKLKETESQVIIMKAALASKKLELEVKETEANEKLKLMVSEQTQTEKRQKESEILAVQMSAKQIEIKNRKQVVDTQLAEAEPALKKAQDLVSNINPKELQIIQSYKNPPDLVKLTLEALVCLLNNNSKKLEWSDIRKEISKQGFVQIVIKFDTDSIKKGVKDFVIKNYIQAKEWNLPNIYRASSAAGPLAEWVDSQLKYADILVNIDPLRKELQQLEDEQQSLVKQKDELDSTIIKLEKKITTLKSDYQILINDKQYIQNEMESVKNKVERSTNLLQNLSSERYRWDLSSQQFKSEMETLIGDVLIAGAFTSYIGFFDHYYRKMLINAWKNILSKNQFQFKNDRQLIEFLSIPSERLNWYTHYLPKDDLCTENAIILNRYHRYPLVIDPSGQALEFILALYKDKKIVRTSFADDAFMKNLETALRFGVPLLVQDVEKIDPILNSVLNKELYKTGGRVLIRVGDQEIDFSSNFSMFMITRDANAKFTPDLCSRVTFVNFTVTPSSLQNQCLNYFLKYETPHIEEKRITLMKLQGEYQVKLRELEDSLLDALSNSKGSILEDEKVINTLETLKKESTIVQQEMAQQDKVLLEVDTVMNEYLYLAQASSKIYFAMQSMNTLHYLYEYSLTFFMDIFIQIMTKNEELLYLSKDKLGERRKTIYNLLFKTVFQKISNSMLMNDKIIFVLKLVQIKLNKDTLFNDLIRGPGILQTSVSDQILNNKLNKNQLRLLEDLSKKQLEFQDLFRHIDKNEHEWISFMDSVTPEQCIPSNYEPQQFLNEEKEKNLEDAEIGSYFRNLTLIKVFRPDRFSIAAQKLINKLLGDNFMQERQINLQQIVYEEVNARSPILMCSAPGFDPSFKIEQLAKQLDIRLQSVAIGSAEGFDIAEKQISQGSKNGIWVMLKNVHLAPAWLSELEKNIHKLNPHQNFRLFLTMEFNPKVPSTLIRQSYVLVFEPPDGIKASLRRTYNNLLTSQRTDKLPRERSRLHFLLAWLHAVLLERLRYTPIGYSKIYELNEADQRCALDLIDELVDSLGTERTNIDPEKLPWHAIRTILNETLYGGKIDNEYDKKILISMVENLFTSKSFDTKYDMFQCNDPSVTMIKMPEAVRYQQFQEWIEQLPNTESPAWSGLPLNVEKLMNEAQTNRALNQLLLIQDVNEEEISQEDLTQKKQTDNKQVQWLTDLNTRVTKYLDIIPKKIKSLARTQNLLLNPLFRFLEREVTVATKFTNIVKSSLSDVKSLCEGNTSSSNLTKQLAKELYSDQVPLAWTKFLPNAYPLSINEQIVDYKKRLDQYECLMAEQEYQKKGVWLGQLCFPEAFLTATRQYVAQNHQWSLEDLQLSAQIYNNTEIDDDSFLIFGMHIQGADWNKQTNQLTMTNQISIELPSIVFKWIQKVKGDDRPGQMMVPVYLNKSRKSLICSLKMDCGDIDKNILYQRAITLIAWNE